MSKNIGNALETSKIKHIEDLEYLCKRKVEKESSKSREVLLFLPRGQNFV